MKKTFLLIAASLLLPLQAMAVQIKVGAMPTPHIPILEFIKPSLAEQGVELEIVTLTGSIPGNLALVDGSLDATYTQHQPYLDAYVKENNAPLVSIGGIHIEPVGLYSSKIKKIEELKDGSTLAIPNDTSNLGRSLVLFHNNGLIRLKDPKNILSTVNDIAENKKNLKFVLLQNTLIPRTLDDFDAGIILTNYCIEFGINPVTDSLILEGKSSPYANMIVTKKGRENEEALQKLVQTLKTDEVREFLLKEFNGAVVPAF